MALHGGRLVPVTGAAGPSWPLGVASVLSHRYTVAVPLGITARLRLRAGVLRLWRCAHGVRAVCRVPSRPGWGPSRWALCHRRAGGDNLRYRRPTPSRNRTLGCSGRTAGSSSTRCLLSDPRGPVAAACGCSAVLASGADCADGGARCGVAPSSAALNPTSARRRACCSCSRWSCVGIALCGGALTADAGREGAGFSLRGRPQGRRSIRLPPSRHSLAAAAPAARADRRGSR